jgi:hypothetical protein
MSERSSLLTLGVALRAVVVVVEGEEGKWFCNVSNKFICCKDLEEN